MLFVLSSRVLNLWYRECAPIVFVTVCHLHHLYLLHDDVMLAAIQTFSLLLVISSSYSSLLLVQRINGRHSYIGHKSAVSRFSQRSCFCKIYANR